MVNGMNTVHIWLCFLAAKEMSKNLHNVLPSMNLMSNTMSELLFIKKKKILWLLPGYTIALPDEKQP